MSVCSCNSTRAVSRFPVASNKQSSTFSACSEYKAKLTPSPSQVDPRGYGLPGHTTGFDASNIQDHFLPTTQRKTAFALSSDRIECGNAGPNLLQSSLKRSESHVCRTNPLAHSTCMTHGKGSLLSQPRSCADFLLLTGWKAKEIQYSRLAPRCCRDA